MASFLLSECLENIFLNFIKHPSSDARTKIFIKDLYSCTLVSRHWCRISTPFLYAYPFNHFNWWDPNDSYFKLIRTLLSCVPQSEIRQIYITYAQQLVDHIFFNKKDSYSNISSTFNYVSFIRGFIFDDTILESQNVCFYKNIWLSAHNPKRISSRKTIRIMNHLIKFICKHCCNLTMLGFPLSMKYNNVINLSQFISSIFLQKKLQHIILSEGNVRLVDLTADYRNVFNLLSMQSVSLRTLEFNGLSFDKIDEMALNSLCLLKNIRVLRLRDCYRGNLIHLNSWAKSLTKLEVLEITSFFSIPNNFLNHLLQSSSNTLTKLVINISYRDPYIHKFQQIPFLLSLSSLIHLELPNILPSELISIFKSCIKLVYLRVILSHDEDLKCLGRFVPKTLEKIQFELSINEATQASFKESLGCFLKEYINNSGALKYLEVKNNYFWIDNSVTEKFGDVQITVYYNGIISRE